MNQTEAIKHTDVYGKDLYYLKITNRDKTVMVNVGKTTYDKVINLEKDEKVKPLDNKNK